MLAEVGLSVQRSGAASGAGHQCKILQSPGVVDSLLDFLKREQIRGVLRLNDQWQVSIFTLAGLLNTSPGDLLELMEDYALGEMIEEVEGDELFEGQEGWQVYQSYLAEAE